MKKGALFVFLYVAWRMSKTNLRETENLFQLNKIMIGLFRNLKSRRFIRCQTTFQLMGTNKNIVWQKKRHRFYIDSLLPSLPPHPHSTTTFRIHFHMHLPLLKSRKRMSCIGLNSAHNSKRRFRNLNMELLGGG